MLPSWRLEGQARGCSKLRLTFCICLPVVALTPELTEAAGVGWGLVFFFSVDSMLFSVFYDVSCFSHRCDETLEKWQPIGAGVQSGSLFEMARSTLSGKACRSWLLTAVAAGLRDCSLYLGGSGNSSSQAVVHKARALKSALFTSWEPRSQTCKPAGYVMHTKDCPLLLASVPSEGLQYPCLGPLLLSALSLWGRPIPLT